jgi:hypothetical protein
MGIAEIVYENYWKSKTFEFVIAFVAGFLELS